METSTAIFLAAWDNNMNHAQDKREAKKAAKFAARTEASKAAVAVRIDALTEEKEDSY